uniref:V-type proton ATPase subunit C n=1 Tax=Aegilops tauschii subsp. strangulata TaxID=200361 RepID=A0A453GPJ6_AEGTS
PTAPPPLLRRRPRPWDASAPNPPPLLRLQDAISRHSFDTPLYQFTVPDLRPGTLDSLLALSDNLVKSNIFIEGVSHKIRRQIEDLERAGGVEPGTLTVDGVPVDSYLTRFVWGEGKYPVNAPLKETVTSIQSQVAKIEDLVNTIVLSIMDILFHC